MFQVKWILPGEGLAEAADIRLNVFCAEQGYSPSVELDEIDIMAHHIIVYDENTPVATGRFYKTKEDEANIGRIAVVKDYRGTGVGAFVVNRLVEQCKQTGVHTIKLDAQKQVIGFYERMGFAVCGEEHLDGHILHREMIMEI